MNDVKYSLSKYLNGFPSFRFLYGFPVSPVLSEFRDKHNFTNFLVLPSLFLSFTYILGPWDVS